jgi:hypothetical protein
MSNMLEKEVEKYMGDQIKRMNGLSYKFSSGESGVPDRIVIYKGHVFFVELKTKNGKISARQKLIHEIIKKTGGKVVVLYGKDEVDVFLNFLHALEDTRDAESK